MPDEAADQGYQHSHARGGRQEILHGQAQHLHQVAYGRLAAVALPVCICGKAYCSIKGQVGCHWCQTLRVQRQKGLKTLQQVYEKKAGQVEEQHGQRIGFPVHFFAGVHAGHPVDKALHWSNCRIQESALTLVDTRHVGAQGLDQQKQDEQVQAYL